MLYGRTMLTREQILEAVVNKDKTMQCLDGRDFSRLIMFFPSEDWIHFGFTVKEGETPPAPQEWTRENILAQLKNDVDFGFEKALGKRGISASFMYEVVKMWMWVLEDKELLELDEYAQYGLPLFKAVAVKYGFPNPIDDDTGSESHYSNEDYYDE